MIMKVSIKRLSEITGFSQATVSNALNNKRGVNKETSEKIFAAARENGYTLESHIKNIKLVVYKNSGVIVSDTPFFSALIEGIESESRNAGYETTVLNLYRNAPDFDTLLAVLLNDPSSAIILLATEMMEEDIIPFTQAVSPVVVVDNWFEKNIFNSVLQSNTDSVYAAVSDLIEKGHRKIGYLKGNIRIKNFTFREAGYKMAMADAGLKVDDKYTFLVTPTMEDAHEDMKRLLQDNSEMPTAFFADNDNIALGVMKALKEYGYKIPKDISIIGLDDMPFCTISSPALSTIKVQKSELGRTAVRRLLEIIDKKDTAKLKIHVWDEYIERDSVRDLNGLS